MNLRILLLLLLIAPTGMAQSVVRGRVVDFSNKPVGTATVVLKGDGQSASVLTNNEGLFSIGSLAQGTYRITISVVGLVTQSQTVVVDGNNAVVLPAIRMQEALNQLQSVEIIGRSSNKYTSDYSFSATKIATANKNIPQSISTVTKELIADRQAFRIGDVLKNVSGVSQVSFYNHVAIRGFTQNEESRLVNGMRTTQIYFNQPLTTNLERVEIIKGPASASFANADPGGSINLVTKKPLTEARRQVSLSVGSFNTIRGALDFTGPLNEDKTLLYRLNIGYEDAKGFRDLQFRKALLVAPSFSYVPNDKTRVNLELTVNTDNSRLDRGQPIFGAVPGVTSLTTTPITFALGAPNDYYRTQDVSLLGNLSHAFTSAITLNVSYLKQSWFEDLYEHRTSNAFAVDSAGKTIPTLAAMQVFQRLQRWSTDNLNAYLSINAKTGPLQHRITMGYDRISLVKSRGAAQNTARGYVTTAGTVVNTYNPATPASFRYAVVSGIKQPVPNVPNFDLTNPLYVIRNPGDYVYTRQEFAPSRYNVDGLYVQDQINAGKLLLTLGLRQDYYEDLVNYRLTTQQRVKQSKLIPRVGLTYTVTSHINAYATYLQGYQPQTAASLTNPNAGGPFNPLTSTLKEVGAKTSWLKGDLTVNIALFDITQRNILISANDPINVNRLAQRGGERGRGVEVELAGNLAPNWQVNVAYAYLDAQIIDDLPERVGLRKENTPANNASLWTRYDLKTLALRGLGVGFGVQYQGSRIPWFSRAFELPAFTVADAAVYYKVNAIQLAVNAGNLFNKTYWVGGFDYFRLYPGTPRNVMLNVTYQF